MGPKLLITTEFLRVCANTLADTTKRDSYSGVNSEKHQLLAQVRCVGANVTYIDRKHLKVGLIHLAAAGGGGAPCFCVSPLNATRA